MLSQTEKKLIKILLEMASSEFSNHSCNDFDLSEYFSTEESKQIQYQLADYYLGGPAANGSVVGDCFFNGYDGAPNNG